MKQRYIFGAAMALAAALPVMAAEPCSIHPPKGMSDAQLKSLEAEHGCLIWSFDLRIAGKSGVEEVQVDAGNGKVLSVKHESSREEAAEAGKE